MRSMLPLMYAAAVVVTSLPAVAQDSATDVARRLQQDYSRIRDFQADFVQTLRTGQLGRLTKHEGRVYVKKPGKMRWNYEKPERQEVYWTGRTVYVYYPQDQEALKREVSADGTGSTALLFLAGQGDLLRDFTPSLLASPSPGTIALKLTPKQAEPDYESIVLRLEEKTLTLSGLTTLDTRGEEVTFEFRNLRENTGLNDRMFAFTPPKGVQVQDTSN